MSVLHRQFVVASLLVMVGAAAFVLVPSLVDAQGLVQPCPNPADNPGDPNCRDINILVLQLLLLTEFLFSIIGSLAFVMFVVGGFMMILSFGNAERFKKGQKVLVAAVVGLIISLSAYVIVSFVLDALGVQGRFLG